MFFNFANAYGVLSLSFFRFSGFSASRFLMNVLTFFANSKNTPQGGHILFRKWEKRMGFLYFLQTSFSSIETILKHTSHTRTETSIYMDRFIDRSMYWSIRVSIHVSIHLFVHVCIYQSINRSINQSIYASIHLSIFISIRLLPHGRNSCLRASVNVGSQATHGQPKP